MRHKIQVVVTDSDSIFLELDDAQSPKTVAEFVQKLPFQLTLHVWGQEIYSSESPIVMAEENAISPVQKNDVAYWPKGRAVCLFYGPTPIGSRNKITPASPVNVLGKILNPDKSMLVSAEGRSAVFKQG